METTLTAVRITPEGDVARVTLDAGKYGNVLLAMYAAIGANIVDVVQVRDNLDMWLDDEGLLNGSEINDIASVFAASHGFCHQPYYGTALLTGGVDDDGDTVGLTDTEADQLIEHLRRLEF